MKLAHKAALIVGSFAAPGFAQAVTGRRRSALVWLSLEVAATLLATFWLVFPLLAMAVRLAAAFGTFIESRRDEGPLLWWRGLSIAVLVVGLSMLGVLRLSVASFAIPTSSMYPTVQIGDDIMVDTLSVRWRPPARGEVIVFRYPCDPEVAYVKRVIAVAGDTVEVRCNVVYVNGTAIPNELVLASGTYRDYDGHQWLERPRSVYRERHGGHTYEVFHDAERPARDATRTIGDVRDFPTSDFPPACSQADVYDRSPAASQPRGTLVVTKPAAAACEPQVHYVVPRDALFVMGDNRNNASDSRAWGAVSVEAVIGRAMGIWMSKPPGDDGGFGRFGSIH